MFRGTYTLPQVISNLKQDIAALSEWLRESKVDCRSILFREKAALLRDKIEELENFILLDIHEGN